jgi:hypothetical protein
MDERMCRAHWRDHAGALVEWYRQGNTKVLIKTPPPVPLRPPQKLQTGVGSNPSLRGERSATNRLSHFLTACQFPVSRWSEYDAKAVAKRGRTVRYRQPAVFLGIRYGSWRSIKSKQLKIKRADLLNKWLFISCRGVGVLELRPKRSPQIVSRMTAK